MKKIVLSIIFLWGSWVSLAQISITQIQGQQSQSPYTGQTVTTSGLVTAVMEGLGYFIQDGDSAWTGLYVYETGNNLPYEGDSVRVKGMVDEYYDWTELKNISSLDILSKENPLPEPVVVLTGDIDEAYESVLVKVVNAECTNENLGFEEWELNDGSGSVRANDLFYDFDPIQRTSYDVTGVVEFSYSSFKINPRSANDVRINAPIYFTENPHQVNLQKTSITIQWETNEWSTSSIKYGLTPELEKGTIDDDNETKEHQITISNLEAGELYYVQISSEFEGEKAMSDVLAFTTVSNSSGAIRTIFTSTTIPSLTGDAMKSASTSSMADTIALYISKAQHTLDIAIYDIKNHCSCSDSSNHIIFDAIKAKANAGVPVRLITDDEQNGAFFKELSQLSNAQVVYGNPDGIMHHKFILIDADSEKESWVVTGSVNWTYNNLVMDANNLICIQDESLAKAYTCEFNEMWGSSGFTPDLEKGRFGAQKKNNTPHLFLINEKPVELYFSPSDKTEQRIVDALQTTDYELDFAMMVFTSNALGNAVKAIHNSGKEVKGIIDYVEYSGSEFELLVDAGAEVIDFDLPAGGWPEQPTIHHKFAVVDPHHPESDPLVITGTHNWTASAESKNDENTLIIHDSNVAKDFYDEFLRRFSYLKNVGQVAKSSFNVYPNPCQNGQLFITSEQEIKKVEIYNFAGQLIQVIDSYQQGEPIDLLGSKGLRFIKVKGEVFEGLKKVIWM